MSKSLIVNKVFVDVGLTPNGKTTKFITSTVAKHMDKYVPFRTGALAETVIVGGQPTANVTAHRITYEQEYASYVYKGIGKGGKPMEYNKEKHSYAGPYWDERMMSAEKDTVIREIQKYINRGG